MVRVIFFLNGIKTPVKAYIWSSDMIYFNLYQRDGLIQEELLHDSKYPHINETLYDDRIGLLYHWPGSYFTDDVTV